MMTRLPLLIAPLLLAGCLSHPAPPPAPYHAYGKDSGWDLIIDDQNLTFIAAGRQPVVQPKPQVIIGFAGEIYQTPRINVNIVHGACTIATRTYSDRVQVSVDGTAHEGCGGDYSTADVEAVPTGSLVGRNWRVAQVNGRSTPAGGDYSMEFRTNGQLGAKFGCNGIGGNFSRSGDTVTTHHVVGTQMACADPAGSFESQGMRILMQPMTLSWSGSSPVLANSAGQIVLAPAR